MNQDQNNEPEPERKPEPGLVPIPDLHLEPRCKQHLFVQTAIRTPMIVGLPTKIQIEMQIQIQMQIQTAIRTPMIVGLPTKSLRSLSSAFRSLKICFDNNLKI